jgi:hypothetical protein
VHGSHASTMQSKLVGENVKIVLGQYGVAAQIFVLWESRPRDCSISFMKMIELSSLWMTVAS